MSLESFLCMTHFGPLVEYVMLHVCVLFVIRRATHSEKFRRKPKKKSSINSPNCSVQAEAHSDLFNASTFSHIHAPLHHCELNFLTKAAVSPLSQHT